MRRLIERQGARFVVLVAYLFTCGILIWLRHTNIAGFTTTDPDDSLRLVQVRDLMHGQSWFDTTQYRINPGFSATMHWSRIVDAPIALLIALLRPLLGEHGAELVTMVIWPLALLALLFAVVANLLRRVGGPWVAATGACILAVTTMTLLQFAPLRIDHHGIQVLFATAATAIAIRAPSARNGALVGLFMALHANVSIEAMPYMVLFAGIFALAWLRDPALWPRLAAYLASLTLASGAILLATHGWGTFAGVYCDALSRPYLAAVAAAAVVTLAGHPILDRFGLPGRLALLALAGIAGGAAVVISGPDCLRGPFSELPPLVKMMWYDNVKEGLPLWDQTLPWIAISLIPTLIGLAFTAWVWWTRRDADAGAAWLTLLLLGLGGLAVSILILRGMYVEQVFVLPGTAVVVHRLWTGSRRLSRAVVRVAAAAGIIALTPAPAVALAVSAIDAIGNRHMQPLPAPSSGARCTDARHLSPLNQLPPALLFAALDIGPDILMYTPDSVVATGHHRNAIAMNRVIAAFMVPPAKAEYLVRETSARYLVICPLLPEMRNYRAYAPRGLAAALVANRPVPWLRHIPTGGPSFVQIWRILPPDQVPGDPFARRRVAG